MIDTTIVVPCYNEASRLDGAVFRRFAAGDPHVGFLFVDDGSRDTTLDVLAGLRHGLERQVRVVSLPANQGKAEAVRRGVLHAIDDRPPRAVGFWDADLATPLEAIPVFRDVLYRRDEVSIVLGSRMPLLGRRIERRPLRRLLGRLFATAVRVTLGLPVFDTQCGAKMFRVTPMLRGIFATRFASRWIFDVELLARWLSTAERPVDGLAGIYELPLDHWRDVAGSRLKGGDFLQAAADLSGIAWRYHRGHYRATAELPVPDPADVIPLPQAHADEPRQPGSKVA